MPNLRALDLKNSVVSYGSKQKKTLDTGGYIIGFLRDSTHLLSYGFEVLNLLDKEFRYLQLQFTSYFAEFFARS